MKKKLLLLMGAVVLTVVLMISLQMVSAETQDVLQYRISNGEVTIVGCEKAVSGKLIIPAEIDGYPVTRIGSRAFYGCEQLLNVVIPDGVKEIGDSAFENSTRLTSVILPKNITSIGPYTFRGTSLSHITIPEGVTSIGKKAFQNCHALKDVTIPSTLTKVEAGGFQFCSGTENIYISDLEAWCKIDFADRDSNPLDFLYSGARLYLNNEVITDLVLPESITQIKDNAFCGCLLSSVTIPEGVTSIGNSAFMRCYITTSVTIPEGVTNIGEYAFHGCRDLTSITIPEGVTSIGSYAFAKCGGLTSVAIPEGVTSIESFTFQECSGLTNVTIPEGITSIGESAFEKCSALTSVIIPKGVTSMANRAFFYCSQLTSVTIPEGVTSIESEAFCGCQRLTSVMIPKSVKSIGKTGFKRCDVLTDVYYMGSSEAWKEVSIYSENDELLNATITCRVDEIEKAIADTILTIGTLANNEDVVLLPGNENVLTGEEFKELIADENVAITSNNGVMGTGSQMKIGVFDVHLVVKGDLDGDGISNVFDALMVKKALSDGAFDSEALREYAADVDGASGTTAADVTYLLKMAVGAITE